MTDLLVGATAGQASSGTHTIIPLCHMPTKSAELLAMALIRASLDLSCCSAEKLYLLVLAALLCQEG